MGMVVRSNLMASNANRQLGMNNSTVSKNLEKLSSGFKINRAGDDASGLAISEKMKAQIKGLEAASANSQDGISLVQTAEGALTEVHSMLNRMTELATKSANGTIKDAVDRDAIQKEVDALNDEIDRIAQSTNFNGINLLDGTMGGAGGATTLVEVKDILVNGVAVTAGEAAATASKITMGASAGTVVDANKVDGKFTFKYKDAAGVEQTITTADTALVDGQDAAAQGAAFEALLNGTAGFKDLFTATADAGTGALTITEKVAGGGLEIVSLTTTALADTTKSVLGTAGTATKGTPKMTKADLSATFKAGDKLTVAGKEYTFSGTADGADGATFKDLDTLVVALKKNGITADIADTAAVTFTADAAAAGGGLQLQVGDTSDAFNQVTISVGDMSAKGIGTVGLDVSTQATAKAAQKTIKDAINTVSTNRASLGAMQNRLEYTINNLDVSAENMSAANSRIRDTDMAKQMMEYTKMNVLTQAAQAMLAQANQQPQSILQLLQ